MIIPEGSTKALRVVQGSRLQLLKLRDELADEPTFRIEARTLCPRIEYADNEKHPTLKKGTNNTKK